MSAEADLLEAFECHSPEKIRKALRKVSPIALIKGKTPIASLVEMYTRSPKFAECLQVMLDSGATIGDPLLQALLLDDESGLRGVLAASRVALQQKLSLLCAYTSCMGVSPLHVCAEFNSVRCAGVLIAEGADVNARADVDEHGIGGQTPIFHAVNSNGNHCRPVMEILVEAGANLDIRLEALLWGGSFEWETVVFDVTPISYAQCGLYRQVHREERDVYNNIDYLHRKRYGRAAHSTNVPNKYVFPPKGVSSG